MVQRIATLKINLIPLASVCVTAFWPSAIVHASNLATTQGADRPFVSSIPQDANLRSGMAINASGDLITSARGLEACGKIYVLSSTSRVMTPSRIVALDKKTGLAVVAGGACGGSDCPHGTITPSFASTGRWSADELEIVRSVAITSMTGDRPINAGSIERSPLSNRYAFGVIWGSGHGFRGSDAGAPVFDKSTGEVVGLVETVFRRNPGSMQEPLPRPMFMAAGFPIFSLFLQDVSSSYHYADNRGRRKYAEATVTEITKAIACEPRDK